MPLKQGNNSVIRLYKLEQGTQTEVKELKTTQDQVIHKRVTITFNANGGSGGSTQTRTWGVEQIVTPSTPTRSGYTFKGWYTAASGGTKITFPRATPANNITYYAQWNESTPTTGTWRFKGVASSPFCINEGYSMIGTSCSTIGQTTIASGSDNGYPQHGCIELECKR